MIMGISRRDVLRNSLIAAALLAMPRLLWAQASAATLYKNPGCDCCEKYADYLRQHGFAITVKAVPDLPEIDRKAGIPAELEGCHTVVFAAYFVSGHVPIEAVKKLFAEKPAIKGITLPGMPAGSPGMDGKKEEPFIVKAIHAGGTASDFLSL